MKRPENQSQAGELIRERLADRSANVRVAAVRLIPQFANLDDIGLLAELLALPVADDEASHERAEIALALETIRLAHQT